MGDLKLQRATTDRALSESEERFRLLVEGTRDYAIFMLDPSGYIVSWNVGAERLKGYTQDEAIGRHFSIFYPPEAEPDEKTRLELEIARATGQYTEEGWRLRKDGTRFWASVLITAMRDESGELRGYGKVTRDLTERRRLERGLIEKNAALEEALRAKDRFLASMSHELRTPLNAVIGFTGTLLMGLAGPLNAEQEKQLRTVQAGGRHLISLINDLLDLAKINSGKMEVRREPVAVGQVLQEVVTTLQPIATARGLELSMSLPPEDLTIATDRRALSQILINLGNNACKFSERGGVRFEIEGGGPDGRPPVFRVSDTGIGIRSDDLCRLFQPFVRLGEDDGGDHGGSGLGLHVSQRLAELLGGRITVESEYGRGSRFTLTLGET